MKAKIRWTKVSYNLLASITVCIPLEWIKLFENEYVNFLDQRIDRYWGKHLPEYPEYRSKVLLIRHNNSEAEILARIDTITDDLSMLKDFIKEKRKRKQQEDVPQEHEILFNLE